MTNKILGCCIGFNLSALIWSPMCRAAGRGVLKDQGKNDFGLGMCLNLGGSFWSQDCYLVFWVQNVHVCLQLRLKTKIIKTEVSEGRRLRSELKQTFSIKGKRKNNLGDGSSSPRLATIPSTLAFQNLVSIENGDASLSVWFLLWKILVLVLAWMLLYNLWIFFDKFCGEYVTGMWRRSERCCVDADCSEEVESVEHQGRDGVRCGGGNSGPCATQKPVGTAGILCWGPGTVDCVWLHAQAQPPHPLARPVCCRLHSGLETQDENCHWIRRSPRVSGPLESIKPNFL